MKTTRILLIMSMLLLTPTSFAVTFTNSTPIEMLFGGSGAGTPAAATPYPSQIVVSGDVGVVQNVSVTLHDISHTYTWDITVLLVGPTGQTVLLMASDGGPSTITHVDLTFTDQGAAMTVPPATGIYHPTNNVFPAFDSFPPAPSGPYGTALSGFAGTDPTGIWSLYVLDAFEVGDDGVIAGGWSLTFGQSFTYQGRLLDNNTAANGLYDIQFKLYDNLNPGIASQVGPAVAQEDISVIDGYFAAELGFGDAAFNGDPRWLQIEVRPYDSTEPGDYVALSPLQPITPSPYAMHAANSSPWQMSGSDIFYNGSVGIGTSTPQSPLDIAGQNWNLGTTEGDFRIGSDTYRLKVGVAVDGGGAGDVYMRAVGGTNRLNLGSGTENVMTLDDGKVGIGTMTPAYTLDVQGDLNVTGNVTGSIHYSQITGFLGYNITLAFPDVLYNQTEVEITGIAITNPVVVIHGPGFDIDRIEGFLNDHPNDQPGFSAGHPFIFECSGTDAANIQAYFDAYLADPGSYSPKAGSVITNDLGGTEVMRWNFYEYIPQGSEPGDGGRTRFTMVSSRPPGTNTTWENAGGSFGSTMSNNPLTDTRVEIAGVSHENFYPQVEVDTDNRTITLTYDFNEGSGLYEWAAGTRAGAGTKAAMSVIEEEGGLEVSRTNYFGTFPMTYELIDGFGLDTKIKARVVLSYDFSELG